MKSWRTTIGGALGTLGTSITGLTTLSAFQQFNGTGNISQFTMYLFVSGSLISCLGKFFTALFAADNKAVQQALSEHSEAIAEVKGDTTKLTQEVRGQ